VTNADANYVMPAYTGVIAEANMREGNIVEKGESLFLLKVQTMIFRHSS